MGWYEVVDSGTGGSGGLLATEIVILTADYTSEPLEPENANMLMSSPVFLSSTHSSEEPEETSEDETSEEPTE